jgi:hypothetical protein
MGVAWSVNDGTTADRLVALADDAMYESKRQRDGRPIMAGAATVVLTDPDR